MAAIARLDSVTRRYGDVVALDDATIDVGEAEILGLLGPNGAGKTTVMSLLRGLIRPTEGRVELFGRDPATTPRAPRSGSPRRRPRCHPPSRLAR